MGMSSDLLLKVVVNGKCIFAWIEQGTGKYANGVILLIYSSKMREAQAWINNGYGKQFKIKDKPDYERSAMEMKQTGKD